MTQPQTAARARLAIVVTAGLLTGRPNDAFTRRYTISSVEWEAAGRRDGGQGALLAEVNGRATGYASYLMLLPNQFNWVRSDWNFF